MENRPPLPPFTHETAIQKVRLAEEAWNARDPVRVSLAYTVDSRWRNRSEFLTGRPAIVEFLTRKWTIEQDYRLIKESSGPSPTTASLSASSTSGMTRILVGFGPAATSNGSSPNPVS